MFKHPLNTFTGYSSFVWCAQIIGGRDHPQLATHQPPPGSVTTTIEFTFSDFILINFYYWSKWSKWWAYFLIICFHFVQRLEFYNPKFPTPTKRLIRLQVRNILVAEPLAIMALVRWWRRDDDGDKTQRGRCLGTITTLQTLSQHIVRTH